MPPPLSPRSSSGSPCGGTLSKAASMMGVLPKRAPDDWKQKRASPLAAAAASRSGMASLSSKSCAMTLTWISRLYPSSVVSSGDAMMPELSMRTSSFPSHCAASAGAAALTASSEFRSQSTCVTVQPAGTASARSARALRERSEGRLRRMILEAPREAASLANLRPRPLPVAPVMAIALPAAASAGWLAR
eukprot:scaffold56772_cov35-Tisochrysis_lutea.AAC.1